MVAHCKQTSKFKMHNAHFLAFPNLFLALIDAENTGEEQERIQRNIQKLLAHMCGLFFFLGGGE